MEERSKSPAPSGAPAQAGGVPAAGGGLDLSLGHIGTHPDSAAVAAYREAYPGHFVDPDETCGGCGARGVCVDMEDEGWQCVKCARRLLRQALRR